MTWEAGRKLVASKPAVSSVIEGVCACVEALGLLKFYGILARASSQTSKGGWSSGLVSQDDYAFLRPIFLGPQALHTQI